MLVVQFVDDSVGESVGGSSVLWTRKLLIQPICALVGRSVCILLGQSVGGSVSWWIRELVGQPIGGLVNQPVCGLVHE